MSTKYTPLKAVMYNEGGSGEFYGLENSLGLSVANVGSKATAERLALAWNSHDALVAALELAQRWLANCTPTIELDGPKPLPVIAAALAAAAQPQQTEKP